jgi:hypothetical protein
MMTGRCLKDKDRLLTSFVGSPSTSVGQMEWLPKQKETVLDQSEVNWITIATTLPLSTFAIKLHSI